jgi:hypothetical protein
MKLMGFLRWQFGDCYKGAQFWAFAIMLLALAATLGGCPGPIPFYILLIGAAISFVDTIVWVVRWQYRLYQLEQNRIVQELSKK